jgi:hypothetical protein
MQVARLLVALDAVEVAGARCPLVTTPGVIPGIACRDV